MQALGTIACPSTEIVSGPNVTVEGVRLVLSFSYQDDDDAMWDGAVTFSGVRAYRHRAEGLCTAWHIEGAYDTLAEVGPSEWTDELRDAARPEWRDRFPMRHFMIYLDSYGALEVLAADAEILPPVRVLEPAK